MGEVIDLITANRNARRRKRYADDKAYRDKCIATTRSNYRRDGHMSSDLSCMGNLDNLSSYGLKRRIPEMGWGPRITFNVKNIAEAMNRHKAVVNRWIRNGLFPSPPHWGYYTLPQVRVMVRAMGELQNETPYYRRDHVELRAVLFNAVGAEA